MDFNINNNVKCLVKHQGGAYNYHLDTKNLRSDKFKSDVWLLRLILEKLGFSTKNVTGYNNGYCIVSAINNERSHIIHIGASGAVTMSGDTDEIMDIFAKFAHACFCLTGAVCEIVVDNLKQPMQDLDAKRHKSANHVKLIDYAELIKDGILSGTLEECRVITKIFQIDTIGPRLSAAKIFAKTQDVLNKDK